jgi:orotate phosphoribosyltransferase-like protein
MSVLNSRINSIESLAIAASVSKADAANPTLYGSVTLNATEAQGDGNFTSNVPATFNKAVAIVDDLYVYGNAHFNNRITVQSLITTISALDVEGISILNGATTILSDFYVAR